MAVRSWVRIRKPARSTAICRAGTCRTCSLWAQARSRRTPATTPRGPWQPSPIGRLRRSADSISRTRGRLSMPRPSVLISLGVALAAGPLVVAAAVAEDSDQQKFAQIEHGRYLATLADCVACHTKKEGGKPFAGGRPLETPFGVIVTPNITPDRETGIGNWTDEQFD